jgi:hypothetical protein
MPPHRKDWARAVLNELPYIESRRAIFRWVIESTVFAVRERITYELENSTMNLRVFKTTIILIAIAVSAVVGTYAIQKPYQQERIKFTLHRLLDAKQT